MGQSHIELSLSFSSRVVASVLCQELDLQMGIKCRLKREVENKEGKEEEEKRSGCKNSSVAGCVGEYISHSYPSPSLYPLSSSHITADAKQHLSLSLSLSLSKHPRTSSASKQPKQVLHWEEGKRKRIEIANAASTPPLPWIETINLHVIH